MTSEHSDNRSGATNTGATKTALLVLGMHRSGTSLLSGLIAASGVSLGENLMAAAPDNPKGFWENQAIVDFNESLLNLLGQTWASWGPLPDNWIEDERLTGQAEKLRSILDAEFGDAGTICIKDPRLCRLLPFWKGVLAECGFSPAVACIGRPVTEVAASLEARDSMGPMQARALWLRYGADLLASSEGLPRFGVSYEDLLKDPASCLQRLQSQLGVVMPNSDHSLPDAALKHHDIPLDSDDAWAVPLYDYQRGDTEKLPTDMLSQITPLLTTAASLEQALAAKHLPATDEQRAGTAREQALFAQTQDAKQHAGALAAELATGRTYIAAMEEELAKREDYARSLEAALETAQQQLAETQQSFEEDIARREEYTASLLKHIEAKEAELASTKAKLEDFQHRYRHVIRLRGMLSGNE